MVYLPATWCSAEEAFAQNVLVFAMGNSHSAPVYDDGQTPLSQNNYSVLGELRAGEIKADIINCERIYVDNLHADKVQLCGQSRVSPPPYPAFPPHRKVKVDDELNVRGTIFAGKVKCEKLNAYDVFYTQDMHADKVLVKDRNDLNESLVLQGGQGQDHRYEQQPMGGGQYYGGPPPGMGMGGPPPGPPPTMHPHHQLMQQHQPQPQPHFRGNFSGSSHGINLDHKFYLQAQCADMRGQHRFSALDLNDYITNDNGQLRWVEHGQSGNFSGSCRGVHLAEGGKVLAGEACAIDGSWRPSHLWLDERVGNENGELKFV